MNENETHTAVKAVLFDMDGTILDTLDDLTDAVNYGLRKVHMHERSREEVRSFLGNGMKVLLSLSAEEGAGPEQMQLFEKEFTSYYMEHCNDRTGPYEGIRELMKNLKDAGIKVAIVSNKPHLAVESLSRDYFDGLSDCVIGEQPGLK